MAAGSTYTPIATSTVSGSSTYYVTFSSIPSTYTDLVFVFNGAVDTSGRDVRFQYNTFDPSESGALYSKTELYGNGTSAGSNRRSGNPAIVLDDGGPTTANAQFNVIHNVMNYANTTTYKTSLSRLNDAGKITNAVVGLWQSTSAINALTFYISSGTGYFVSGSTLTIYGITAA